MHFYLKRTTLTLTILTGYIIFLFNGFNLNLENKNIFLEKKNNQIVTIDKKIEEEIEEEKELIEILDDDFKLNNINSLNEIVVNVNKGQTFSEILNNFNFKNKNKFEIINSINKIFDLKNLKVNQKIIFFTNKNNFTKKIVIELDFKTNLIIDLENKINIKEEKLNTYTRLESKEYFIKNSLYADGVANDVPNEILVKLIKLFSFDLDFQRDIRENTQVSVSYNTTNVENKIDYSFDDIEYAKITIQNNTLEYFRFITDEGFVDYFNRSGKNVKKSILKTPLDGARLSSSFGMRKHPISGFNKMHKGIDFAAPIGTPIYAGGNGIIEYVGRNGGYGKYIRIRHNNEYKTAYAHLSGYKKGISKGVRVNQGEVIGYVGNTGRSTGPHLHYEIIYQNKQINPLNLKLPSGKILEGDELIRFNKEYKMILANHLNNLFE